MAYPYSKAGKTILYIGEENDRCFNCNKSLAGKDCISESNFLLCFDNCENNC